MWNAHDSQVTVRFIDIHHRHPKRNLELCQESQLIAFLFSRLMKRNVIEGETSWGSNQKARLARYSGWWALWWNTNYGDSFLLLTNLESHAYARPPTHCKAAAGYIQGSGVSPPFSFSLFSFLLFRLMSFILWFVNGFLVHTLDYQKQVLESQGLRQP